MFILIIKVDKTGEIRTQNQIVIAVVESDRLAHTCLLKSAGSSPLSPPRYNRILLRYVTYENTLI